MACPHELWEQEGECADGACPICLRLELDRMRLAADATRQQAVAAERERCARQFNDFIDTLHNEAEREEGFETIAAIRKGE